jgi:MoxR-like ATPase
MSIELKEQVQAAAGWISKLRTEIGKVIVGQEQLVDRLLCLGNRSATGG